MARGVHLGIMLVCLVLAEHLSCQKVKDYKVVQSNPRKGATQHIGRPQDQLRQVKITSSNRQAVHGPRGRTVPLPSDTGSPLNLRRAFVGRGANAVPNQKSTVRTNPKVQERANGYSKPQLLWYQRPNTQSAVRSRPAPAKAPALPGPQAAAQPGRGVLGRQQSKVKAIRLRNRAGPKVSRPGRPMSYSTNGHNIQQPYPGRRVAAQSSFRKTPMVNNFDDPTDPRYKQTTNYVLRYGNKNVVIKRLKPTTNRRPQHNKAVPQRRDPPKRQSQRVWTRRTSS